MVLKYFALKDFLKEFNKIAVKTQSTGANYLGGLWYPIIQYCVKNQIWRSPGHSYLSHRSRNILRFRNSWYIIIIGKQTVKVLHSLDTAVQIVL